MSNNLLECFLYQSKLAPGVDVTCVAQIVKAARIFNNSAQITGVLVFDGECFCQYIEGPSHPIQALITSLGRDPRHVQFTPMLHRERETRRRFDRWTMAYAVVDDVEVLSDLATLPGGPALDLLQELIPQLDAG
ncbi:Blue light- and temperature-regulated antirepressor YcgF [Delftia tsuruhatensis]|uniref:BLUF domain-containing protein n=1 Tax=Delftia tsuruhatensis TaxID=180282 RepID=UPI001E7B524B|nr:BLUF domain-containing protein [Delftia tsuruhatensis]CAB5709300.1 Blue light- and temperature-regulated antirepressor YcgF [Delftia tsuruhatensis]CAC9685354.1 Blue light- and temperature-regulated antirepressor YcgF [Delftia tsuruhatensis]